MAQEVIVDGAVVYREAQTRNGVVFQLFPGLFGVWFDGFHGIESCGETMHNLHTTPELSFRAEQPEAFSSGFALANAPVLRKPKDRSAQSRKLSYFRCEKLERGLAVRFWVCRLARIASLKSKRPNC